MESQDNLDVFSIDAEIDNIFDFSLDMDGSSEPQMLSESPTPEEVFTIILEQVAQNFSVDNLLNWLNDNGVTDYDAAMVGDWAQQIIMTKAKEIFQQIVEDSSADTSGDTRTDSTTVTESDAASDAAPQYAIDAITSPYSWGDGPITVTFSFLDGLPDYYSSGSTEASDFSVFNASQEASTRQILDNLSSVANITFVESSDADAQITFANTSLGGGIGGWAYYPYSSSTSSQSGDVWINSDYGSVLSPTEGNFAYMVLLHEIGHAVGLEHPHDGTSTLSGAEDSRQYTVESYKAPATMGGYEPQTYMVYDVAALQNLYGANTSTGAGDDVYDFTDAHNLIETIWDAGGLDTIDASGRADGVTIDLHAGAFSSIGTYGSGAYAASDNIAISYGVTIENAVGGSGDDILIGNAAGNMLTGGTGADQFVFDSAWGDDVVSDFEDGVDILDLRALGVSFAEISIGANAAGAVISYGSDSIQLDGIASSQIDEGDFLFA